MSSHACLKRALNLDAPSASTGPSPAAILHERKLTQAYGSPEVLNKIINHPKSLEAALASGKESDIFIVTWDGPNDPINPRNWSYGKKWAVTAVVSTYTVLTPISSAMVAPATEAIAHEFNLKNDVMLALIVSIFILAYAFGPLFLGPLSEIYGRARVLQAANLFFLVFNIACGLSRNITQLLVFRLFSGLGGSAPLSIGGAVLGDCWATEERGRAVGVYSLAPLLGPVLGPIVGSWISEQPNWRWVFWSTSIFCGTVQVAGFLLLHETFAPVLLEQKAHKKRIEMHLRPEERHRVQTPYETSERRWQKIFARALSRPFMMFFYEPIIQSLGVYMAFVYGLFYFVLTTVPGIFQGVYGQSVGIAGLHYIALGVGLTSASQINAHLLNRVYKHFQAKNGGQGKPEYRLPCMFPGAAFLPIGLLIFGWTARSNVFWIVPDIGIAFIGAGISLIFQSIQNYVIDAFTLHAASALAAVACLRSLAGFGFPLFALVMYDTLGYGKCDTILAGLAIGIGFPVPFILWYYGERIRKQSRYINKH